MPPPLIPLHGDGYLNRLKLAQIGQLPTEWIVASLLPGQRDCLKARPDGTILDGHHRVCVLRARGVDVNALPREIIWKTGME